MSIRANWVACVFPHEGRTETRFLMPALWPRIGCGRRPNAALDKRVAIILTKRKKFCRLLRDGFWGLGWKPLQELKGPNCNAQLQESILPILRDAQVGSSRSLARRSFVGADDATFERRPRVQTVISQSVQELPSHADHVRQGSHVRKFQSFPHSRPGNELSRAATYLRAWCTQSCVLV